MGAYGFHHTLCTPANFTLKPHGLCDTHVANMVWIPYPYLNLPW